MIVSVHQPHYLPWTGYFDKIDRADVFVLLDTVQFEKNGWQNRNRIKSADGWQWLTVPVEHRYGATIEEISIDARQPWARKHRNALAANYARTPFFSRYAGCLDEIYSRGWDSLNELNCAMLDYFLGELGIKTSVLRASALGTLPEEPNERLAALVSRLGGDTYLAGSGCTGYFRPEPFERAGVKVEFQEYRPAEYPQWFGAFEPGLSIIDLLCNCGDGAMEIIRNGGGMAR